MLKLKLAKALLRGGGDDVDDGRDDAVTKNGKRGRDRSHALMDLITPDSFLHSSPLPVTFICSLPFPAYSRVIGDSGRGSDITHLETFWAYKTRGNYVNSEGIS